MLKLSKRLGLTLQVHPDHREFIRVENEVEIQYENSSQLPLAAAHAQAECMLLNLDDALEMMGQMLLLHSTDSFRTNLTEWLKQQATIYTAKKQALVRIDVGN